MTLFLTRRLRRRFFLLAALAATLPAVHGATPEQLPDDYTLLAVPEKNVVSVRLSKAAHTMPTMDYGKDCGVTEAPYNGQCRFDAAKGIINLTAIAKKS